MTLGQRRIRNKTTHFPKVRRSRSRWHGLPGVAVGLRGAVAPRPHPPGQDRALLRALPRALLRHRGGHAGRASSQARCVVKTRSPQSSAREWLFCAPVFFAILVILHTCIFRDARAKRERERKIAKIALSLGSEPAADLEAARNSSVEQPFELRGWGRGSKSKQGENNRENRRKEEKEGGRAVASQCPAEGPPRLT